MKTFLTFISVSVFLAATFGSANTHTLMEAAVQRELSMVKFLTDKNTTLLVLTEYRI